LSNDAAKKASVLLKGPAFGSRTFTNTLQDEIDEQRRKEEEKLQAQALLK
jgi:hypothetical protein